MNPEHDKSHPAVYSHTDFVEAVARETGTSSNEITQRQEPEASPPDDLLVLARQAIAEHGHDGSGIEALVVQLNLREQYERQRQILHETAVIDHLPSGEFGFRGVDGQVYALPSYEQVVAQMAEKAELLETKAEQGFTKLLLVPIAKSRDVLKGTYADALLDHNAAGEVKDSNGEQLALDDSEPVYWWDDQYAEANDAMVYYPREFGPNHQGLTKAEVIDDTARNGIAGWEILLIEDLPDIPADGTGPVIGGRAQLEAGLSPDEYLDTMRKDASYQGESGFTPEAWLTYAITHLAETNQVIDDYQGGGKISNLTGAYFPGSDNVPDAYWNRDARGAYLDADAPGNADPNYGVRSAVRVS